MANPDVSQFLDAASKDGCIVEKQPALIAVFGGELTEPHGTSTSPTFLSWRDSYVRWVHSNRGDIRDVLLMPESYSEWNTFNNYSDLLRFEADLGFLTAAVVIFLESPGSIAELGAFSQIESLRDRLVVVVEDSRHPKASFISLGPLRQLENDFQRGSICVIPKSDGFSLTADINTVVKAIDDKLKATKTSDKRPFDPEHTRHQFTLALDAICLMEAVTATEIEQVFQKFGVDANLPRIRQILFTLHQTKLVRYRRYGGIDYYLPTTRGVTWLDYKGPDASSKFNRPRIAIKIQSSRSKDDPKRRVIESEFSKVST